MVSVLVFLTFCSLSVSVSFQGNLPLQPSRPPPQPSPPSTLAQPCFLCSTCTNQFFFLKIAFDLKVSCVFICLFCLPAPNTPPLKNKSSAWTRTLYAVLLYPQHHVLGTPEVLRNTNLPNTLQWLQNLLQHSEKGQPTSGESGLCTPRLGGPGPRELGGGEVSEPSLGPPAEALAASAWEPTGPHRFPGAPQAFPLPPEEPDRTCRLG